MPRVYRVMTNENGRPLVGESSRALGIRPGYDIRVNDDGSVEPGKGGMSVSPQWQLLPHFLIPRRLRDRIPKAAGNNNDACWAMHDGDFQSGPLTAELVLHVDRPIHGTVQPARSMLLNEYETALAATRDAWRIDEV